MKKNTTTALSKDEVGALKRLRETLAGEIGDAWCSLQSSLEQIRRRYYYTLGEKLIQLRMTFKSDKEFGQFCNANLPGKMRRESRLEYMNYREKLGKIEPAQLEENLPPLRHVTRPNGKAQDFNRPRDQYRKIVDEEVDEDEASRFEVPRTKKEQENELVLDLAEKIINAGFRVLSVKLHPDKGGSNDVMRRLGAAKELLLDTLQRAELMM
jgi:hypothetical protein